MNLLLRFSIRARLMSLVFVATLCLFAAETMTLMDSREQLTIEKQTQTRMLAESAVGIADYYYKQSQSGALAEAQAKQIAATVIGQLRHSGKEYFWINDMDGIMVMHPIKKQLDGTSVLDMRDPAGKYMFREFVDAVRRNGEGVITYQWPKPGEEKPQPKISYVKGFAPWGWVIGTGIYVTDLEATFRHEVAKAMVQVGIILALLIAMAFVIVTSILQPLRRTSSALEDIASGEGDLTRRLPVEGTGELARLARAFNSFAERVQTLVQQVSDSALRVADAAAQLGSATSATREAVQHQQLETDQVATAMNQMTAAVQEVAKNSSDAAQSAHQAQDVATEGHRLVHEARTTIDHLSQEVQSTAAAVGHLEEEVARIGSVLEVIRGVAEQTNLLALNAAIEAARAGEQGRGFAVVADEVRTLAARTQQSTEEIRAMIDALRAGAQNAVSSMASSQTLTGQTVEKAEAAALALEKIAPTVAHISDMSAQIASATQEQESVAREIDRNVIKIATEAEQAASTTAEVTRASERLAQLGEELRALVRQFKV